MSKFAEPLAVEITDRKKRGRPVAKLLFSFSYYDKSGTAFIVPAGFETDFASSPRWLWSVVPPLGSYSKAAVLHDFLYVHHQVTRKEADRMLRDGAKALGVGVVTRNLIWASARIFGAKGWKRDGRI